MKDPLFFKKENNTDGAKEFKRCLPVNVNTSFTTLAPAIATVEQQRLKPLLGKLLFEDLSAYYAEHGTSGNDSVRNEVVGLVQMAVVRLAYWDSFDQLAVMIGDSGIIDQNGDKRAFRYQADRLKESLLRQGFAYLNQIVSYCCEHILTLNLFQQSEYYCDRQESTIRSMKEMESVVSINGDFFLFARLREYISETETMELPYRVGSTLATLLTADRNNQKAVQLLRAARGFVAHWSIAEAIPFLNIEMTAHGPMVTSEESTGSSGGKVTNPPRQEQILALQERHRDTAERYIGQLVTYCKRHSADYPEIAEIGLTTEFEKTASFRENRGKKTFLA